MLEQPESLQLTVTRQRMAGLKELQELVEQPRRRHAVDEVREPWNRRGRIRMDREAELCRETRGSQHAHRVLAVPRLRIADQAQLPRLDVGHAAGEVPDRKISDVVVKGIGREVPAPDVFLDGPVDVVADQPTGLRGDLPVLAAGLLGAESAESRDLDDLPSEAHVGQTEAAADQATVAEQRAHVLRVRIGRDVEVLRVPAEEQITDAATDQERLVARVLEAVENLESVFGNVGPGNIVFGPRNDLGRVLYGL